jgi:histidinol-phosphate/aromatic aminotransferase/cobyric acid decarboxylase-like protein
MLIGCPCAADLRDHLASAHGILVRDCTSFGLPGHVRIAARVPSENDRLIHALRQALS